MKVFVTGGSGYVGTYVVRALVGRGIQVAALARNDRASTLLSGLGADPVRGGLADVVTLRQGAESADAVIHLGQHRGPDTGDVDRAAAQALADGVGAGPYIHTGGAWVYGNTGGVVDESAPFDPPQLTAWRLENEKLVLERAATGGRPIVVMPGVVYGGGGGLIEQFYAAPARTDGFVRCIGDGTNHWALVHVEDIAELYVRALNARPGSVYAGVSGVNPAQKEIVAAVAKAVTGRTAAVRHVSLEEAREQSGPIADAFALDQQLTGARAQAELAWAPVHTDPLGELAAG